MTDEAVKGLSDLIGKMNDLPLALGTQKNILVRAARKGGEVIRQKAEDRAPVYQGEERIQKRGKKEFKLIPGLTRDNEIIVVSEQTATGCVLKIGPYKPAFYSKWEEFGAPGHGQPAHAWLRPALDETADQALSDIGGFLGPEIEKEMAKL